MKRITIFLFFGVIQGCAILSPYEVAQQDLTSSYVDAKGYTKLGIWHYIEPGRAAKSEVSDLRECVSLLTLENSGTGTVKETVASAQLVNCMRKRGWELKFERIVL